MSAVYAYGGVHMLHTFNLMPVPGRLLYTCTFAELCIGNNLRRHTLLCIWLVSEFRYDASLSNDIDRFSAQCIVYSYTKQPNHTAVFQSHNHSVRSTNQPELMLFCAALQWAYLHSHHAHNSSHI